MRPSLLALLLLAGSALAQDPTKNPRYEEFHKARIVIMAKLDEAKSTGVQETFPPRYLYELTLSPTEVFRGKVDKGKVIKCAGGITSIKEPKLPVGKEVLVQLETADASFRLVKLEEASAELKAVAKAAATAAQAEADRDEKLAREEPQKHPRYKGFKDAPGLAIISPDANGVASFDIQSRTMIMSMKAEEILKGKLEQGPFKAHVPQTIKLPPGKRWLVTYKMDDKKVIVTSAFEESEVLMLVAKAAIKK